MASFDRDAAGKSDRTGRNGITFAALLTHDPDSQTRPSLPIPAGASDGAERPARASTEWMLLVLCTLAGGGLFVAAAIAFPHAFGSVPPELSRMASGGVAAGFLAWLGRAKHAQVSTSSALRWPLFVATVFVILPSGGLRAHAMGLDPSWMTAIAMAVEDGRVFGRDFIFTYGPLGYLVSRVPPQGLGWTIPLHDAALFLELVFWTVQATKRLSHPAAPFMTFGAFAVLGPAMYREYAPLLWSLVIGLHGARFLAGGSVWHVTAAAVISVFLCFIKLNVVPAALLAALLPVVWVTVRFRRTHAAAWLSIPAYAALFPCCAWLFNVDLVAYAVTSARIADGYADAMYVPVGQFRLWFLLYWEFALLIVFAGVVVRNWWRFRTDHRTAFLTVVTTAYLFIAFKQGHVRHWGQFVELSPAVFWVYFACARAEQQRLAAAPLMAALIIAGLLMPDRLSWTWLPGKAQAISAYGQELVRFSREGAPRPRQQVLHPLVRELIGNRTIDVLMWNNALALFERLNYNPRPVIQSYVAYDAFLDGLNAAKYESNTAPQVLLFETGALDDRYWFFDETRTRLAMLRHYRPTPTPGPFLMLERCPLPRHLQSEQMEPQVGRLGVPIRLGKERNALLLAAVDVRYSILGRLIRFLYQPPALRVSFRLRAGEILSYRAIVPIVNGGVIVNKFVQSPDELSAFISGAWRGLRDVEAVTFHTPDRWGFQSTYSYHLTRIQLAADRARAVCNQVPGWSGVQGYAELLARTGKLPSTPDDITWMRGPCISGYVERVEWIGADRVRALGWAYLQDVGRPADAVLVTRKRAGSVVSTAATIVTTPRSDVVAALGPNAHITGWSLDFDLPPARDPLEFWVLDVRRRIAFPLCPATGSYEPIGKQVP